MKKGAVVNTEKTCEQVWRASHVAGKIANSNIDNILFGVFLSGAPHYWDMLVRQRPNRYFRYAITKGLERRLQASGLLAMVTISRKKVWSSWRHHAPNSS